jgi:hypothetical protein
MATAYQQWFQQWASDMASGAAPGGKVDRGPVETLVSKPGRQAPTRKRGGSKVPPVSKAFARKLGP